MESVGYTKIQAQNTEQRLPLDQSWVTCPERGPMRIRDCYSCNHFRGRDWHNVFCKAAPLTNGTKQDDGAAGVRA